MPRSVYHSLPPAAQAHLVPHSCWQCGAVFKYRAAAPPLNLSLPASLPPCFSFSIGWCLCVLLPLLPFFRLPTLAFSSVPALVEALLTYVVLHSCWRYCAIMFAAYVSGVVYCFFSVFLMHVVVLCCIMSVRLWLFSVWSVSCIASFLICRCR